MVEPVAEHLDRAIEQMGLKGTTKRGTRKEFRETGLSDQVLVLDQHDMIVPKEGDPKGREIGDKSEE